MTDSKQGEREYYARIGPEGIAHALRKPFVPDQAAQYLANFTALVSLLPEPPQRVLELGCGTGWLSLRLAQLGYHITGVDISPEAIAAALKAAGPQHPRARFITADFETFAADSPFDFVIFYDALHHAESEHAALRAAHAALRPGGAVIAFEPGVGHGAAPQSREAVSRFGVHEQDMPPQRIMAAARALSFSRHLVLPRPIELTRAFYRPVYHRIAAQRELRARRLLGFLRFLPLSWRIRDQGIVVLWK